VSDSVQAFQVSTEAAEIYEEKFVPALFGEWAEHVIAAADVRPGEAVIDVACGTGIVARAAADRVGETGRVVGLDLNEGMLAVARRIRPDIEWHHGDVGDLPFPTASFDTALCQAALMYFPDRVKALREMARVVKSDGVVVAQVWGPLDAQVAYRRFADIAARHAGPQAPEVVGSYFSLGDLDLVEDLFAQAGLAVSGTVTRTGAVRFASIDEFVAAEIEGSPLIDQIDDEAYERIRSECREELGGYSAEGGKTEIPIEGHIITGRVK